MLKRRAIFRTAFHAFLGAMALFTLGGMVACGGGGSSSSTPASTDPHITSFVASSGTITAGDTASLTAVFERGTGMVTPGNYPVTSGVALTGPVDVTTTYTLTVTGAAGTTPATAATTITVLPAPVITSFSATPSTIASGATTKLNAVFTGGTAKVAPGNLTLTSGVDLTVGPLTSTTTYTLTVANAVGTQSATGQTTVTVAGGGGGGTQSISGTVTYDFVPAVFNVTTQAGGLDFASAVAKPVRNGVVYMMEGSTILATTTTDATGHYALSYTPTGAGTLQVAAMASSVTPSIIVQDNTDAGSSWGITTPVTAGTATANLHATHGWAGSSYTAANRTAAPFAILDSLYTASQAFMTVRPSVVFPALHVNWSPNNAPQSGDKTQGFIGTSHFWFLAESSG